jgi:iron complex outermembrane recepter protein
MKYVARAAAFALLYSVLEPRTAMAADETDAQSNQLQEIVVTAEKRSQGINNVGLTITAFTADTLEQQNVKSVQDLANIIPGLSYSQTATNTPVYTLRGVGFNENSLASYSDVAVYVDQVPLPFPALTTQAGLDLNRVEVLKGPQGILYGENATGGAINYIPNKPTDEFEAGVDVGYGRFNDTTVQGFVSGPLSSTVTARVTAMGEYMDPWQYSYTRDDQAGEVKKFAGRLLMDWSPSDRLKVELNLNGWLNESDPQIPQLSTAEPQNPTPNAPFFLAYPPAPHNDRAADWAPAVAPRGNEWMFQTSLRGDYNFASDLTLTSISSFIRFMRDNTAGASGLNVLDDELASDRGNITNFDQEVRLANGSNAKLRWMTGGNFEYARVDENAIYVNTDSTATPAFGFDLSDGFLANQRMKNYAGFANVEYDVASDLTLKVGGRLTQADRSSANCTYVLPSYPGLATLFTFLTRQLTGNPNVPTIPVGGCSTLNAVTFLPGLYNQQLNQGNASWRVGLDYKATPDILIYMNVAKGYKAGSIGAISASTTAQFAPVVQESVLDYEGGFKARLFDGSVQLDGAAFHYDYSNKQVRGVEKDPIFGLLDILINIPKSRIDGGELSLAWRVTHGLTLSGSATYLHTKVTEYTGLNNSGALENFAGAVLPFTPSLQFGVSADYTWTLFSKYPLSVGAAVNHKSRAQGTIGESAIENIDPYSLLDLRASIASADGAWRVLFYGKNVTDKYYWTNVVHEYDSDARYTGMPATFGVKFNYRWLPEASK